MFFLMNLQGRHGNAIDCWTSFLLQNSLFRSFQHHKEHFFVLRVQGLQNHAGNEVSSAKLDLQWKKRKCNKLCNSLLFKFTLRFSQEPQTRSSL